MAGFISERWPASNRNGGRHQIGIGGRIASEFAPITIGLVALSAHFLINLPPGGAILLAAMLSPTDPVLAAGVQVGPPGAGEEGEVKFALTSEAGLNDGLAFPFVSLGLLMIDGRANAEGWLLKWLLVDALGKSLGALAIGFALAWTLVKANAAYRNISGCRGRAMGSSSWRSHS